MPEYPADCRLRYIILSSSCLKAFLHLEVMEVFLSAQTTTIPAISPETMEMTKDITNIL
jgi:hypothetical protein